MASNTNKRNKGDGTLGPQKYLGNQYSQKSLHDPDNAYNSENLNSPNRPNEYDLVLMKKKREEMNQ